MEPTQEEPRDAEGRRFADWFGGRWVWLAVALFAVVALSIRFAVSPGTSEPTASGSTLAAGTSVTPTSSAPTTSSTTTSTTLTTIEPGSTDAPGTPGVWAMPNVIGSTLSSAKGEIGRVADGAEIDVAVHDATGAGRDPIIHQNWKVCAQSPTPGNEFTTSTEIDLGIVKNGETCPGPTA